MDEDLREQAGWVAATEFHEGPQVIYSPSSEGDNEPPGLVKRRNQMAHVRYDPAHPNPHESGWAAGNGAAHTVWIASEQPGTAEGIWSSGLLGVFDTELAGGAAIGWHVHWESEELYLVITGSLTIAVGQPGAPRQEFLLGAGDSHRVPVGWGHAALAGPQGARILVVELRS